MVECPICLSSRILHLRHDQDWGGGNFGGLVNPRDCYTEDDLRYDECVPDIDIYNCLDCNFIWDRYQRKNEIWDNIQNNIEDSFM